MILNQRRDHSVGAIGVARQFVWRVLLLVALNAVRRGEPLIPRRLVTRGREQKKLELVVGGFLVCETGGPQQIEERRN